MTIARNSAGCARICSGAAAADPSCLMGGSGEAPGFWGQSSNHHVALLLLPGAKARTGRCLLVDASYPSHETSNRMRRWQLGASADCPMHSLARQRPACVLFPGGLPRAVLAVVVALAPIEPTRFASHCRLVMTDDVHLLVTPVTRGGVARRRSNLEGDPWNPASTRKWPCGYERVTR